MREENLAKAGRYSAGAMAASYDALYRRLLE
jgi:hypothetical protein